MSNIRTESEFHMHWLIDKLVPPDLLRLLLVYTINSRR